MKSLQLVVIISILGLVSHVKATDSLMISKGEALFTAQCKACHHLEMRLVGPALKGVEKRHDHEWLVKFIRSSQTMVQAGDSAAVSLFNTYNKVIMPDQPLTDAEIESVLAYIIAADNSAKVSGGIERPSEERLMSYERPLKFSDYRFWILYTITVVLVIVAIYYKAELIALQNQIEEQRSVQ